MAMVVPAPAVDDVGKLYDALILAGDRPVGVVLVTTGDGFREPWSTTRDRQRANPVGAAVQTEWWPRTPSSRGDALAGPARVRGTARAGTAERTAIAAPVRVIRNVASFRRFGGGSGSEGRAASVICLGASSGVVGVRAVPPVLLQLSATDGRAVRKNELRGGAAAGGGGGGAASPAGW